MVDDNSAASDILRRLLRARHFVETAVGAGEALEKLLAGEHYDVILCELEMQGMSGIELYWELLVGLPDDAAKMVFISPPNLSPEEETFLRQVPNAFFKKPFRFLALSHVIERGSLAKIRSMAPPPG